MINPQVQCVNVLTNPQVVPQVAGSPSVVRGLVVGVEDDSKLSAAYARVLGSVSQRTSSLTHVTPRVLNNRGLGPFYPEFLRKRATPARLDVAAEEVDNELLLAAQSTSGEGREFTGLSAEIRDFLKIRANPKTRTKRGPAWPE